MHNWEQQNDEIRRTFAFENFTEAMVFVNTVAELAEAADHHPDIHIERYRTVTCVLTTHDAGNTLTEKDHALAEQIDNAYTQGQKG